MPQDYKLIQTKEGPHGQCFGHVLQRLPDLYNDPRWKMETVDVDKIQFVCKKCGTERVYKILPEKTLL